MIHGRIVPSSFILLFPSVPSRLVGVALPPRGSLVPASCLERDRHAEGVACRSRGRGGADDAIHGAFARRALVLITAPPADAHSRDGLQRFRVIARDDRPS